MPDYPKLRLLPAWTPADSEEADEPVFSEQSPQPVVKTAIGPPEASLWAQAMLPVTKRPFGPFHAFAEPALAQANYATARCGEYIPSIGTRLPLSSISRVQLCAGCGGDYAPRHTL